MNDFPRRFRNLLTRTTIFSKTILDIRLCISKKSEGYGQPELASIIEPQQLKTDLILYGSGSVITVNTIGSLAASNRKEPNQSP
jgi:hypothetical protein